MVKGTLRSIRSFYDLFRSGLTSAEIEKLLSADMRGMYSFYVRNIPAHQPTKSPILRFFKFVWFLFLAFLVKMTPARRLFYAVALGLMALAFWDDDLMKALYGFLILNVLLALELADKLVTRDELEFAREIQLSLLPDTVLPIRGFSLATHSEVAQSVGGDYYDLIPMKDGSTMVIIGDVSGKGISAALYMVKVQTALQLLAKEAEDPRELMIRLNEYLYRQFRRNYFLTISIIQVHPDGSIQCCRAGHMPALVLDGRMRMFSVLQPRGTAIGMTPPEPLGRGKGNGERHVLFAESLEMEELTMKKGDLLVLYTDGVIEGVNRQREEFGEERLRQAVLSAAGGEPEEVKAKLIERIAHFRNGEELRDDTTFVVLKKTSS